MHNTKSSIGIILGGVLPVSLQCLVHNEKRKIKGGPCCHCRLVQSSVFEGEVLKLGLLLILGRTAQCQTLASSFILIMKPTIFQHYYHSPNTQHLHLIVKGGTWQHFHKLGVNQFEISGILKTSLWAAQSHSVFKWMNCLSYKFNKCNNLIWIGFPRMGSCITILKA